MKLLAFLLILGTVAMAQAAPQVILSTGIARPGDTVRIEIDGLPPAKPLIAVWNKKNYRFFAVGSDAQRALIGVKLGTPPGQYKLHFQSATPGAKDVETPLDSLIEVASRTYIVEDVVFPDEKTHIFNENLERAEGAKIHKVLLQQRAQQSWEGKFQPPVDGPIEGEFGVERIRNHTIHAGFHKGVDLKAPADTPVLAANAGVVGMVRTFRIHGRTVIVNHGQGITSIYIHMKSFAVKPGQRVSKGEMLGRVGSTGIATGPHVHWGVYVHGVPVDPAVWLGNEF